MAIDWAVWDEATKRAWDRYKRRSEEETTVSKHNWGKRAWGQGGSLEGQRKLTQTPPRSAFTTPLTPPNAPPPLNSLAEPIEGEGCEVFVHEEGNLIPTIIGRRRLTLCWTDSNYVYNGIYNWTGWAQVPPGQVIYYTYTDVGR